MVEYDLHIHSNSSDGILTPNEIFKIAIKKKLKGISVTDHDTIAALKECESIKSEYSNIEFVPGIELSTDYFGDEIHILGYYINYNNEHFKEYLKTLQSARYERANKIIDILNNLGYKINLEDVIKSTGENLKSIGRPHIARSLVAKQYFRTTKDVFDKLIGFNKPAYVERFKLSTKDAIKLIKDANGIPVVAHPLIVRGYSPGKTFEKFISELISYGIEGLEAYHTLHTKFNQDYLLSIAYRNNLLITGGSDCHGNLVNNDYILGTKGINSDQFELLKERNSTRSK